MIFSRLMAFFIFCFEPVVAMISRIAFAKASRSSPWSAS
jgi:hypothetical protein